MSQLTTHDVTMLRYSQEYVAPEDVPRVLTDGPPLADLQACMSTDQQPAQPAAPVSPSTLAAISKRLADAREQVELAESELAELAANLAGHN